MFKLLLTAIIVGLTSIANAETPNNWDETKYDFRWLHVPVVCGTTVEVQRYLDDNKFKLVSMSLGREGANPDGDMAYLVTYYIKDDETESVSAVTSPSGHETCMLYRSFDLRVPGTQT